MKLYYHKTTGGAEYLCSNNVPGTDEGTFNSAYVVRIDGDITKDAEICGRCVTGDEEIIIFDDYEEARATKFDSALYRLRNDINALLRLHHEDKEDYPLVLPVEEAEALRERLFAIESEMRGVKL